MSRLQEDYEEENMDFKWGIKKGVDCVNEDHKFYESFVYEGVEYNLYDCVYVYSSACFETCIGKLVEVYETPNCEKKVKLVWFLRPTDVRNFLKDYEPRWNELFLASGEGIGLSNINPLEVIIGKCNVLCASNDWRNPRASGEELQKADYIFYRTFDVAKLKIEESFSEEIDGVKVEHFFNRKKDQAFNNPLNSTVNVREWIGESSSPKLGFGKAVVDVDVVKDSNPGVKINLVAKELERAAIFNRQGYSPSDISMLGPTNSIGNCQKEESFPENIDGVKESQKPKVNEDKRWRSPSERTKPRIKISGENCTARKLISKVDGVKEQRFSDMEKEKVIVNPLNSRANAREWIGKSSLSPRLGLDNTVGGHAVKKGNSGIQMNTVVKDSEKSTIRQRQSPRSETSVDKDKFGVGRISCSQLKNKEKVRYSEDITPASASGPPLKKIKFFHNENARRENDKLAAQLVQNRGTKNDGLFWEVTPRPDSSWEKSLQKGHELDAVLSLENLDPSYTSSEVEDLVWHALNRRVQAKMLQRSTFSSPYNGKALVIFKSKDAADFAIAELRNRCLVLEDGRPVICRRQTLREPSKPASFVGHLSLDKVRHRKQRDQQMKNGVSTSHCSQLNTIEYEMAMDWCLLQEKSDLWWKALHEQQEKHIRHVRRQLKINFSGQECHSEILK
ncbi:hypothetical protein Q3G72_034504 [Acer saccharum]|nr:hypothetical protein Q3G72_034504 [Acer saccharum]